VSAFASISYFSAIFRAIIRRPDYHEQDRTQLQHGLLRIDNHIDSTLQNRTALPDGVSHEPSVGCRRTGAMRQNRFTVGRVGARMLSLPAIEDGHVETPSGSAVRFWQSAVDVVINPKKSVLQVEFPILLEEVSRAFEVIARKMAEK